MDFLTTEIPPLFYSLITLFVALLLWLVVKGTLNRFSQEGFFDPSLGSLFLGLSKWLIIIAVILLCLGYFGLSVATLWASLTGVIALIALGFVATWSVLSNLLSSILLIIFSPFRIGDEIEVQEPSNEFSVKGKVASINMMFTTLSVEAEEGGKPTLTRIPNNIFFQKYIRCVPGKNTQSLKGFIASEHED